MSADIRMDVDIEIDGHTAHIRIDICPSPCVKQRADGLLHCMRKERIIGFILFVQHRDISEFASSVTRAHEIGGLAPATTIACFRVGDFCLKM